MEDGNVLLLFLWRDRDSFHVNHKGLVVPLRQKLLICLFLKLPCTFQAHIFIIGWWSWHRTLRIFLFFLGVFVQLSQINYVPSNLFQGIKENLLTTFPLYLAWAFAFRLLKHLFLGCLLLLSGHHFVLHLYKSY